MNIYINSRIPQTFIDQLEANGFNVLLPKTDTKPSPEMLLEGAGKADFILNIGMFPMGTDFMNASRHLKGIALCSVGYDHVDLEKAVAYGIPVSNTPDVLSTATAETAFLLMLTTSRKAYYRMRQIERGEWQGFGFFHELGIDLNDKTLGIFGLGRIGMEMAKKARGAFSMNIIYHNRQRNVKAEETLDARYVSFDELLAESDVLSIHSNLTPQTEYRFDANAFKKMKNSAIIVNTARGKIIRETDLIEALENKEIWGAGLDVTDPEPMKADNPLLQMSSVCVLPHIGSATHETRMAMIQMSVDNILAASKGQPMPQIVNREVYNTNKN